MEHLREIIKLKRKLYELPRTDELTKFNNLKNKNAKELIEAGADNLVAGSYIFKKGPAFYLEQLNSLR
jgi:ribulose-phosphate 3-epimerase